MNIKRMFSAGAFIALVAGSLALSASAQEPLDTLRERAVRLGREIIGGNAEMEKGDRVTIPQGETGTRVKLEERQENQINRLNELKTMREEKRMDFEERVMERKVQFEEKVARLDAQKQEIAKRVFTQLGNVKERMLNSLLSVLDRLDVVLTNVATRAEKAVEAGALSALGAEDVSGLVRTAEAAIASARDAAHSQFDVVRETGEVTDVESLREEMSVLRDTVREDLAGVREKVRLAHEAVKNAAAALTREPREE